MHVKQLQKSSKKEFMWRLYGYLSVIYKKKIVLKGFQKRRGLHTISYKNIEDLKEIGQQIFKSKNIFFEALKSQINKICS